MNGTEEDKERAAPTMLRTLEFHPFRGRGLSNETIRALVDYGLALPEELLFMGEDQIRAISGIGETGLAEIKAYWAKFPLPKYELVAVQVVRNELVHVSMDSEQLRRAGKL
jgi:hypothetical protein